MVSSLCFFVNIWQTNRSVFSRNQITKRSLNKVGCIIFLAVTVKWLKKKKIIVRARVPCLIFNHRQALWIHNILYFILPLAQTGGEIRAKYTNMIYKKKNKLFLYWHFCCYKWNHISIKRFRYLLYFIIDQKF